MDTRRGFYTKRTVSLKILSASGCFQLDFKVIHATLESIFIQIRGLLPPCCYESMGRRNNYSNQKARMSVLYLLMFGVEKVCQLFLFNQTRETNLSLCMFAPRLLRLTDSICFRTFSVTASSACHSVVYQCCIVQLCDFKTADINHIM